jgi:hypothetical protein
VVAVVAVLIINCAVVVDATATIPSSALMAAAKTPLPPPPSTVASNDDDCYCHRWWPPLPLPHSQQWTAAVAFVDGNSNGKGRHRQGRTRAQGQGRRWGGKGCKDSKGKGNGEGKGKGKGKDSPEHLHGIVPDKRSREQPTTLWMRLIGKIEILTGALLPLSVNVYDLVVEELPLHSIPQWLRPLAMFGGWQQCWREQVVDLVGVRAEVESATGKGQILHLLDVDDDALGRQRRRQWRRQQCQQQQDWGTAPVISGRAGGMVTGASRCHALV